MNARTLVVAGVVGIAACSGNEPTSPAPSTATTAPGPAAPITVASIQVTPGSISILASARQSLFATVRGSDGSILTNRTVTWTSSDPEVVSVGPWITNPPSGQAAAEAFARRAGTATITATVEGRLANVPVTVVVPTTDRSVVAIDSFFVIEFQYPSEPDRWFYAPKVRLKEKTGEHSAQVIAVDFVLPGFGPAPKCTMSLPIAPGAAVDLFGEAYGDYELSIDSPSVGKVSPGLAKAIITVRDDMGVVASLTANGPIVSGTLPTTYSGGSRNTLSC